MTLLTIRFDVLIQLIQNILNLNQSIDVFSSMNYVFDTEDFTDISLEGWEIGNPDAIHTRVQAMQTRYLQIQQDPLFRTIISEYVCNRMHALLLFSDVSPTNELLKSEAHRYLLGKIKDETHPLTPPPQEDPGVDRSLDQLVQFFEAYQHLCVKNLDLPLTKKLILETHQILIGSTQSGFRTVGAQSDMHVFIPPEYIKSAISALIQRTNDFIAHDSRKDPYSVAANLSYDFLTIHPFGDGNGRMSRLLINYILLKYGLPFPCSLGYGHYQSPRYNYNRCLKKARYSEGRPRELSTLILFCVYASWSELLDNYRLCVGYQV